MISLGFTTWRGRYPGTRIKDLVTINEEDGAPHGFQEDVKQRSKVQDEGFHG
jgi:hypothetical protein